MNFNISKQRKEIWFHLHEPNNLYDLWLHQNDKQKYILQIYDKSEWHTIGGDGDECKCPVWIQSITNKPSWWTNAENYDWHKPKQVSLSIGNNNISLYGPIEESISIEIPSVETTNMLNWVGSEDGFLLGTLQSSVNGVQASVELKIDLDNEITGEDTDLSIPCSQAVYELVNHVLIDLQEQINDKLDKIPEGTNGLILSWNNGFQWIDSNWFTYLAVTNTNAIIFSQIKTPSHIYLTDAYLYDLVNDIDHLTIMNVTSAKEVFKAGVVIKCNTSTSNPILTIGDQYNIVWLSDVTRINDTDDYSMTPNKIYYIYIKMDSIMIYSIAVSAHHDDTELNFDYFYFHQLAKQIDQTWTDNVRNTLANHVNTGDSDNQYNVYFMNLIQEPNGSDWSNYRLLLLIEPGFIFIGVRNDLNYNVIVQSLGLISKLKGYNLNISFEYNNHTYNVYRYGYQNTEALICVISNNN